MTTTTDRPAQARVRPRWIAALSDPVPRTSRRLIATAAFTAVVIVVGLVANIQWQTTLTLALLTCMGSLALNLLMGTAGQVSMGNAGMLAVGAYSSVWFLSVGIPFPLDVICAAVAAAVAGLIVGTPALRLRGLYLAIATLAAHFIILFLALQYQNAAAGPSGFILEPVIPGRLRESQAIWIVIIAVVVALTTVLVGWLMSGRTGRTWRLIRDHENVAVAFGINTTKWKLGAFVISSAILGVQGSLFAHYTGGLSIESFTLGVAILYIAMVVIGGLDSIAGSIFGALLLSSLPTVVPAVVGAFTDSGSSPAFGANLSTVIYGALILVAVVYIPRGVIGALRARFMRPRSAHRASASGDVSP